MCAILIFHRLHNTIFIRMLHYTLKYIAAISRHQHRSSVDPDRSSSCHLKRLFNLTTQTSRKSVLSPNIQIRDLQECIFVTQTFGNWERSEHVFDVIVGVHSLSKSSDWQKIRATIDATTSLYRRNSMRWRPSHNAYWHAKDRTIQMTRCFLRQTRVLSRSSDDLIKVTVVQANRRLCAR